MGLIGFVEGLVLDPLYSNHLSPLTTPYTHQFSPASNEVGLKSDQD